MKKTLKKISLALGILMVVGALLGLSRLDDSLANGQQIEIEVPGDDTLVGFYYPGNKENGILLLEGFGSDQTALRPMVTHFAQFGYPIMTFDFSGHGRSPGGLDFDNASTDRMAKQVLAAEAKFREISGLESWEISFIGHSLGARVGLQAATMTDTPPGRLVLLGTQVNLATNEQAEFFTGTSDADLEWVQALGKKNPEKNIILISGEWDDILTPSAAELLREKLEENEDGTISGNIGFTRPIRTVHIIPQLLHNYEIYDNSSALGMGMGKIQFLYPDKFKPHVNLWLLGLAGLFISLISGIGLGERNETATPTAKITKVSWFIGGKLLLWIPTLIPGAVIASAVFFAPLGTPAFNLYYIGFFGGYGVLMWFLYFKGRVPGMEGKILLRGNPTADERKGYLAGFILLAVLLAVSLMARSGWWYTFPFNHRFIWLLVFTPITALGFIIGYMEIEVIRFSQPEKGWLVWVNGLVGLFPFFLYTAFLAALGSISGVVGSIQGLAILGLAICTGTLVEKISARPWLAALLQAFLLYWLILPQGVLFR